MPYDPNKHHRRSIRLQGYDYSQAGAYFVTMCTQNRELLFVADEVVDMIQRWWNKLPEKFPGVETDAFVIMPNHSHGIIVTVGVNPRVDPGQTREYGQTHGSAPTNPAPTNPAPTNPAPTNPAPTNDAPTLGTIIQWFKTMTTNEYIRGVKELNWPPFPGKLWQRNYYEHIIRNDRELNAIRQYIIDNPAKWEQDRDNPIHIRPAIDTVAVYLREAGL
jgi:putative transposase